MKQPKEKLYQGRRDYLTISTDSISITILFLKMSSFIFPFLDHYIMDLEDFIQHIDVVVLSNANISVSWSLTYLKVKLLNITMTIRCNCIKSSWRKTLELRNMGWCRVEVYPLPPPPPKLSPLKPMERHYSQTIRI